MDAAISDGDYHFGVQPVTNWSLGAGVEEGFCILWLDPSFEDLLLIENYGAVTRGQITPIFDFIVILLNVVSVLLRLLVF